MEWTQFNEYFQKMRPRNVGVFCRLRWLMQRLRQTHRTYSSLNLKLTYCGKSNAFANDCTKHIQNDIENIRMHSLQADYVSPYWYEGSFIYFKLNI